MANKISRRTLLRGTGVALALPWLEVMADAAPATTGESLSEPPLRMAFLYFENGVRPEWWNPPGDAETGWEITPHRPRLNAASGVCFDPSARMRSASPSTSRSHTICVASGVTSRAASPVPPVVTISPAFAA